MEELGSGTITGIVIDGITDEPIKGVSVNYLRITVPRKYESFENYIRSGTAQGGKPSELMGNYVEERARVTEIRMISATTAVDGTFQLDDVAPADSVSIGFWKELYNEKRVSTRVSPNGTMDFGIIRIYQEKHLVDVSVYVFDEEEQIVENAIVLLTKTDEYYPNIPTGEKEKDIEIENVPTNERVFFDKAVEAITYYSGTAYVRIEPGTYKIEVSKFGYKTELVENVLVDSDYRISITLRR